MNTPMNHQHVLDLIADARRLGGPVLLSGANLERASLRGANLGAASLQGANLKAADLQEASLRGAYLQSADLRGANLRDADLRGAHLNQANLMDADLQGANLRGAYLWDADVTNTDLRGAHLGASYLGIPFIDRVNLISARFSSGQRPHAGVGRRLLDWAAGRGGARPALAGSKHWVVKGTPS